MIQAIVGKALLCSDGYHPIGCLRYAFATCPADDVDQAKKVMRWGSGKNWGDKNMERMTICNVQGKGRWEREGMILKGKDIPSIKWII